MLASCGSAPPGEGAREQGEGGAKRRQDILATGKALYSQHDEELIIRDFFQDGRQGFFLDVGCAWPKKNSNTYYLESELGWSGIGVDALPDYAQAWRHKRRNSRFFNYVASDHSGSVATFFRSELPGISSIHKTETFSGRALKYEELRVPTITLTKLLDDNGVARIDLLSMDIEGAELQALAGFDIERFAPRLVCIEVYHAERAKILAYFSAHGYAELERYRAYDGANSYFAPDRTARSLGPRPAQDPERRGPPG